MQTTGEKAEITGKVENSKSKWWVTGTAERLNISWKTESSSLPKIATCKKANPTLKRKYPIAKRSNHPHNPNNSPISFQTGPNLPNPHYFPFPNSNPNTSFIKSINLTTIRNLLQSLSHRWTLKHHSLKWMPVGPCFCLMIFMALISTWPSPINCRLNSVNRLYNTVGRSIICKVYWKGKPFSLSFRKKQKTKGSNKFSILTSMRLTIFWCLGTSKQAKPKPNLSFLTPKTSIRSIKSS